MHMGSGKSAAPERENSSRQALAESAGGSETNSASQPGGGVLDDARFTLGVVKLYEALFNEPIPEDMLRLVEKLADWSVRTGFRSGATTTARKRLRG